jgi:hypothetical protein
MKTQPATLDPWFGTRTDPRTPARRAVSRAFAIVRWVILVGFCGAGAAAIVAAAAAGLLILLNGSLP